jgi:RNA polymerase sigma factor (sigma-70 family)
MPILRRPMGTRRDLLLVSAARLALRLCRDQHRAEDVLQNALLRFKKEWRVLHGARGGADRVSETRSTSSRRSPVDPPADRGEPDDLDAEEWSRLERVLTRCVIWAFLDAYRRLQKRRTDGEPPPDFVVDPDPNPEERVLDGERRRWLDEARESLTADERLVLDLDLDDYTQNDIATLLDIAPGTVASRLRRARDTLRNYVEEKLATPPARCSGASAGGPGSTPSAHVSQPLLSGPDADAVSSRPPPVEREYESTEYVALAASASGRDEEER